MFLEPVFELRLLYLLSGLVSGALFLILVDPYMPTAESTHTCVGCQVESKSTKHPRSLTVTFRGRPAGSHDLQNILAIHLEQFEAIRSNLE